MLFEPRVCPGFEWVLPVDNADYEYLWSLDGTPKREGWHSMVVSRLTADGEGQAYAESDFPWLGEHVLILRPRAVAVLEPALRSCGELLPLTCPDAELWLFNALTVADALDEAASSIVRFDDGDILGVERYAFRPDRLPDAPIFKVPQLLRGPLFLTDDFVEQIRAHHLTGFGCSAVWAPR
jgi:hypothetical protein